MDDELEYLSPSFDPQTLTVPRLRSILVHHDINYPASAKKSDLVDLFERELLPQAKKILKSRARTRPTTKGISNASTTNEPTVNGNHSDENHVAQSVEGSRFKSSKRSVISPVPDGSTRRRSSRQSSALASSREPTTDLSESDSAARATTKSRKSVRKSAVTPVIKEEESEPSEPPDEIESPFSNDNPFQSGSSPLSAPQTKAAQGNRRKTLDVPERKPITKFSRRNTDFPLQDPPHEYEPDAPANTGPLWLEPPEEENSDEDEMPSTPDDASSAGEEFTVEEQMELARERAKTGKRDLLPARQKSTTSSSNNALKIAPVAVLLAMLVPLSTLWRQEKLAVGYCGVGEPSTSLRGVEIPEWGRFMLPQCESCPQHAMCHRDLETTCDAGFVLRPHPLSVGGIIPLPPTCEADGEKARKVKAVADRTLGELRERNAQWECGQLKNQQGRRIPSPGIEEKELMKTVSNRRKRGMSQSEFDDLWQSAIGDILGRDEVTSNVEGQLGRRNLRSNSLAQVPFSCAVRRSIRLTLARHFWQLVGLISIIGSAIYVQASFKNSRSTEETAKRLASFAMDRLATQAAMHLQDSRRSPETYISMSQLRDDVLRNEFSAKRRQKLWEKVQMNVETNSNVRARVAEGRSGEISRVWEWIGAVSAIDDGHASGGQEQTRIADGKPQDMMESNPLGQSKGKDNGSLKPRHWEEGRPIY